MRLPRSAEAEPQTSPNSSEQFGEQAEGAQGLSRISRRGGPPLGRDRQAPLHLLTPRGSGSKRHARTARRRSNRYRFDRVLPDRRCRGASVRARLRHRVRLQHPGLKERGVAAGGSADGTHDGTAFAHFIRRAARTSWRPGLAGVRREPAVMHLDATASPPRDGSRALRVPGLRRAPGGSRSAGSTADRVNPSARSEATRCETRFRLLHGFVYAADAELHPRDAELHHPPLEPAAKRKLAEGWHAKS